MPKTIDFKIEGLDRKKPVTVAIIKKLSPKKISLKNIAKFASLKRKFYKKKKGEPKLKPKPAKISEEGDMKMGFNKPIVVFGDGKLPGPEML